MKNQIFTSIDSLQRHFCFFVEKKVTTKSEVFLCAFLSFATVIAESIGLAMVWPIVHFIESGKDVLIFKDQSRGAEILVRAFDFLKIDISLISLMSVCFLFILLRQVVNYKNAVISDQLK